jgi:hypothetical protein
MSMSSMSTSSSSLDGLGRAGGTICVCALSRSSAYEIPFGALPCPASTSISGICSACIDEASCKESNMWNQRKGDVCVIYVFSLPYSLLYSFSPSAFLLLQTLYYVISCTPSTYLHGPHTYIHMYPANVRVSPSLAASVSGNDPDQMWIANVGEEKSRMIL